jgi:acetylornithine deacetylase
MIDAVRVLTERPPRQGRVIVAAVIDEEYASIGADALVKEWTADAAVVTEPTDLQIGVGHKGFAWLEVETYGRAAHGSRPKDGLDAIVHMGRVLGRLERLDRELQGRPPHPVMATPSLHASIIKGGREWSSYPASCRLQVERRTIAGETEQSAAAEVRSILQALQVEDPDFRASSRLVFSRPPYEIPRAHALTAALEAAAVSAGCPAERVGMSFWTDAAVLGASGIPSVLFGPGGAGLHSTEEFVNVNEVLRCRDALVRLAEAWL